MERGFLVSPRPGPQGHSKTEMKLMIWAKYTNHTSQTNVKTGCFLEEDVSLFDAPFFSMTAQEAAGMDPMQRLMLEVAYESLENAGIPMQSLPGTMTSVYCGCFTGDYGDLANSDIYDAAPYQATGKGKAMLSNRVSWFFDLRGSSFTVDTACSSSLYALHLACQSLRLKESKMVSDHNL